MKISKSKQELARIISENWGWREGAEWSAQDQNAAVTFFVDTPWRCGTTWEAYEFEVVDGFGVTAKALTNWHQTLLSRDEYFHLYPAPDADGWIEWQSPFFGEMPVGENEAVDIRFGDDVHIGFVAKDWKMWGVVTHYRPYKQEKVKSTAVGDDETNLAAMEGAESVEYREPPEQREKLAKIYAPSIEQLAADYRNKLDYANLKQDEADKANMESDAALSELEAAIAAIGFAITPLAATEK